MAGPRDAAVGFDVLGQAEIRQVGMVSVGAVLDEDVGRLHVAVDHASCMSGVQGAGDLCADSQHPFCREELTAPGQGLEIGPFHVAHRDVEHAFGVAGVVDRDDVRMRERGGRARFADEPLAKALVLGELGRKQLQRDRVSEPRMLGSVDDAHAAAAAEGLDPVAGEDSAYSGCRCHEPSWRIALNDSILAPCPAGLP